MPAHVAIKRVANSVCQEAFTVGLVPDQVVFEKIALCRGRVGEQPVAPVVMNRIVTNNVVGGPRKCGPGARVVGKFYSIDPVFINQISLDGVIAGGLEFDTATLCGGHRGVRVVIRSVRSNGRVVGPLEIDAFTVVMNGVSRNRNSGKKDAARKNHAQTIPADRTAVRCDAIMTAVADRISYNGCTGDWEFRMQCGQGDAIASHA